MKNWIIEAGNIILGVWEAETKEEALDRVARDAGYESFEELQNEVPGEVRAYPYDELDLKWKVRIREQYPDLF